jgi:hypothetical protein
VALFKLPVLGKYDVQYFRCEQCGSLQTERPYWLHESYSNGGLASLDTGAAARVLNSCALTVLISKLLKITGPTLDFGGGDGLLCRLLRDIGYEAYTIDKFSHPSYAQGFSAELGVSFELITAFEVFEHFSEPALEIAKVFASRPRFLLISTELYAGQSPNWWYFAPELGQHVFLYSTDAIRSIAHKMQYWITIERGFILFARVPLTWFQRLALRLIRHRTLQLMQCVIPLLRHHGAAHDFGILRDSRYQPTQRECAENRNLSRLERPSRQSSGTICTSITLPSRTLGTSSREPHC